MKRADGAPAGAVEARCQRLRTTPKLHLPSENTNIHAFNHFKHFCAEEVKCFFYLQT